MSERTRGQAKRTPGRQRFRLPCARKNRTINCFTRFERPGCIENNAIIRPRRSVIIIRDFFVFFLFSEQQLIVIGGYVVNNDDVVQISTRYGYSILVFLKLCSRRNLRVPRRSLKGIVKLM